MELTIEQALQQGVAAHKEGRLQDAEKLYRAILQSQPNHPDANHNLGVLAVSVNKADAALPLFKTALEANPKMEQFWLSYIDALIKTEKVDDARRVLSDAQQAGVTAAKLQIFEEQLEFELSPRSHIPQQEISNPLHNHQGELSVAIELREIGRYKEAQEWLSNVIEHDSRNAEALSLLSQVLLLDKKEAEADKALTAAASINSELPSVYRNQARLLLKQSKTAEALEKAQLGCRQSPEDSESLLVLAACLGANQRDLEALPLIEKILKAKPNYAEAYANRALIKLRAKDTVGAIEDAKMTVSLKPHLTQMWQLLSSLHYQANNLSDAIEVLRRAHKNEPENTAFMIQLGEFLRQDNKVSEAINILEQATGLAPKDAAAWTNLGVAFQQEKRVADAKIAYEKALALNPKSSAIASNLGAMAKEAEEWESALQYFGKALEIKPDFAEAHSNLGVTLQELGRLEEAEVSYNHAIALKPDFAEAHSNLGITLRELGRLDEALASYTQAIALKPDFAEGLHNLSIVQSYKNNLEAEIVSLKNILRIDSADYGLRASVNLAICNFLEGDFAESKKLLLAATKIQEKTSSASKNERVYWRYLSNILRWHENKYIGVKKRKNDKNLYVVGESHSLASHHLCIQNLGVNFFCSAKLIKGCKQWHLGNAFRNQYKHQFETIFSVLPKHSYVLVAIGEIDCRLDTGIIAHKRKFPEKQIKEIISNTIENYLNYIVNNNSDYQHNVTIQGVPCPNIDVRNHSEKDIRQLGEVIEIFNYELKRQSKEKGFGFLDTHQLTNKGDGMSNGTWHIDNYHLSPEGMQEAWRQYGSEKS